MTLAPEPASKTLAEAPVIVRGKISGKGEPTWGKFENDSRQIYTVYTLRINEVLKGASPAEAVIQFRELGGEKDGMGMRIEGAAEFQDGEDVIVLLRDKNAEGSFDLQGMSLGKISVTGEEPGQERLVGTAFASEPPENRTLAYLRRLIAVEGGPKQPPSAPPTPAPQIDPKGSPLPTLGSVTREVSKKSPPTPSSTPGPRWTDWDLFWRLWLIGEGLWFLMHGIIILIRKIKKERKKP